MARPMAGIGSVLMVMSESPVRAPELHDAPVLVVQLQDDLARSRLREAFWISLVVHLLVVMAVLTSPRWITLAKPIPVYSTDELMRNKQLTYLELPHDLQKVEPPPQTDIISDKNRIATRRHPEPDRKPLRAPLDSSRPGAPGHAAPAMARSIPRFAPPQPGPSSQAAHNAHGAGASSPEPTPQPQLQARVEPQSSAANLFHVPASAGSAIEQAARAAADRRVGGFAGSGGDYGVAPMSPGGIQSNLDILSDTMGVDFGPYLSRVLHDVRQNWYVLIPEVARAPIMKKGKVSIEFAILKDGKVAGMRLTGPSGDVSLDRAAWGGITNSNPFPPLPSEFRGAYLALRFHFYYNPDRSDLR